MSDAAVELDLHWGQTAIYDHRADVRFRVAVTGRRWGKTVLQKAEIYSELGTPGLVWYVAPTLDMARDYIWKPLRASVPLVWLQRAPNETRMELQTVWGCEFVCKSAEEPDKLRGRGVRRLYCDEFQDWKNAREAWEEALLPTLLDNDGRALITGTPKSFNFLYELFVRGQGASSDWRSWQYRTCDAPHIDKRLLAEFQATMDPRSYRQEFEASFETIAGRAYYAFNRVKHVAPVQLERAVPVAVSFDFNVEPATATLGQRVGDEIRVWREVWTAHAGGEATRASARAARALLQQAGWTGAVELYGDAAGSARKTTGPSDHAVIREVFPGAAWRIKGRSPHVRDRISAVNGRLETMDGRTHCVIDPTCVHLIADLEQVTFAGNGDLDKSNPMLTHISDAFGYWVEASFPARQVVPLSGVWLERFA